MAKVLCFRGAHNPLPPPQEEMYPSSQSKRPGAKKIFWTRDRIDVGLALSVSILFAGAAMYRPQISDLYQAGLNYFLDAIDRSEVQPIILPPSPPIALPVPNESVSFIMNTTTTEVVDTSSCIGGIYRTVSPYAKSSISWAAAQTARTLYQIAKAVVISTIGGSMTVVMVASKGPRRSAAT